MAVIFKLWKGSCFLLPLVLSGLTGLDAQRYQVGDIVENFTLIHRESGEEVNLYDLEGRVLFLEWFAYWCPFCQAAAGDVGPGIVDYYKGRGGNPDGVEVMHIGLNLEASNQAATGNFINFYGFEYVLNDFSRQVASRFQPRGQPIFAVINGVAGSTSHEQWELIYSHLGYGDLTQPIQEFRNAIDSVASAPEISGYEKYLSDAGVPENQRGETDDPDFDGVINLLEYVAGTKALDTGSSYRPDIRIVSTGENQYPAMEYWYNREAEGVTVSVQISNDPGFSSLNPSVPVSMEPLGNGLERVVVRSGDPVGSSPQFFRLVANREETQN